MDLVAHSRLDTSLVSESEQFTLFKTALGVSLDTERLSGGDEHPFEAKLDAWLIADMMVTAGRQDASRIIRPTERIMRDGFDYVTLMHLRSGSVEGEAGGQIHCLAGQIMVLDARKAMDLRTTDNENIGVRMSRLALTDRRVEPARFHGHVIGGMSGMLLANHLIALVHHAPALTLVDAPFVARATASLARDCLAEATAGNTLPPLGTADARDRAATYIEANLAMIDLSLARICEAVGATRSSLYRSFPGGVGAYIRERRLTLAHQSICNPDEHRGIAEIAYASGFEDASYFSSLFKQRFGYPASALRRAGGGGRGPVDAYRIWLARLADRI
ncbi:MAG: AraC family transcriptional regulator [Janthinobacterium lividum]